MIKMIYEEQPYCYPNVGAVQDYSVKAEFTMNEDATLDQIFDAIMRLMQLAGFSVNIKTFANTLFHYADEHDEWDELNKILKEVIGE